LTVREQLGNVTAEDIQRVAREAFRADNRTVATLVPIEPDEQAGL